MREGPTPILFAMGGRVFAKTLDQHLFGAMHWLIHVFIGIVWLTDDSGARRMVTYKADVLLGPARATKYTSATNQVVRAIVVGLGLTLLVVILATLYWCLYFLSFAVLFIWRALVQPAVFPLNEHRHWPTVVACDRCGACSTQLEPARARQPADAGTLIACHRCDAR